MLDTSSWHVTIFFHGLYQVIPFSFHRHVMLLTFYFHDECFLFLVNVPMLCMVCSVHGKNRGMFTRLRPKVPYCQWPLDIGRRQKIWERKKRCANALLNNLWSIANTNDDRRREKKNETHRIISWNCSLLIRAKYSKATKTTTKWVKWVSFIHSFICLFELNHRCGIFQLLKCSYFVLPGYSYFNHKPQTPNTCHLSFVYFSGFYKQRENVDCWIFHSRKYWMLS